MEPILADISAFQPPEDSQGHGRAAFQFLLNAYRKICAKQQRLNALFFTAPSYQGINTRSA